jgi:hypothetical protein
VLFQTPSLSPVFSFPVAAAAEGPSPGPRPGCGDHGERGGSEDRDEAARLIRRTRPRPSDGWRSGGADYNSP